MRWRRRPVASKTKTYPDPIRRLSAEKTALISKAQVLTEMDLGQTALPLWAAAASCGERLAPLMESIGRDRAAAVHRISGASCYQKTGELGQAANFSRAALAGPLRPETRRQVRRMLADCLTALSPSAIGAGPQ